MEKFFKDIEAHIDKAGFVPVDVSQFSAEQRTIIRRFIAGLGKPNVSIVGDY
ncbi:hypothetical protein ACX9NE_12225 [Mycobacterium sp. ML4]